MSRETSRVLGTLVLLSSIVALVLGTPTALRQWRREDVDEWLQELFIRTCNADLPSFLPPLTLVTLVAVDSPSERDIVMRQFAAHDIDGAALHQVLQYPLNEGS